MQNIITGDFFLLSTFYVNRAESAGKVWLFFIFSSPGCSASVVARQEALGAEPVSTRSAPRALP
jgi:hypothetical protein